MSSATERFVLDANVFIEPKKNYYPIEHCPGYWDALQWYNRANRLLSIDKVKVEIDRGNDDLKDWVEKFLPAAAFADSDTEEVARVFSHMVGWVQGEAFKDAAKEEFLSAADGWLAAFASAHGCTLVTLEIQSPAIRKVPLPNVCAVFGVEFITPYEMLRRLDVRFSWTPPA